MSKILLVLGSLTIFFLGLEGYGTYHLKFYGPKFRNNSPRTADEIWDFADVERHAGLPGRKGEIARLILDGKYRERIPFNMSTPDDLSLFREAPVYAPSEKGNLLHAENFKVRADLNETFKVYGAQSKKVKYSVHYTTDNTGMRKGFSGDKKNILFLGCSFTFGQGLNDENSFPFVVGKKTGYRTFNKGIPGSSPLTHLKHIREQKEKYFTNIPSGETTVVFTLIPEHFPRVFPTNSFLCLSGHKDDYPYPVEEGDNIIIKTRYHDDPFGIQHLQFYLSRLSFPPALGFDFPMMGVREYNLFAKILVQIEKEIKSSFPQVKHFVVALFPNGTSRRVYKNLVYTLEKETKLTIFDYSYIQANELLGKSYQLKYDFHPSPFANELYSDLLIYDLRKSFGI